MKERLRTVSIKRKKQSLWVRNGLWRAPAQLFTRPRIDVAKLLKRIGCLQTSWASMQDSTMRSISVKLQPSCRKASTATSLAALSTQRHGATRLAGTLGQCQTAEGIHVGSIKRELSQLAKIDTRRRGIPTLGIRERELDGNTHVGSTEMRHHRAVGELDHRVNLD